MGLKKKIQDMINEMAEVTYVSCRNKRSYSVKIGKVTQMTDDYFTGRDNYGGYIGVDMTNGEVTREFLDDDIPQPYTAGFVAC